MERTSFRILRDARERGVAYIELALIFAVLCPIALGFVLFFLPSFSARSTGLTNAYAALGTCLLDPLSLYEFDGGRLVLRDDYQTVVQQLLSNCGILADGQTTCAYLFDEAGSEIYHYSLNEDTERKCVNLRLDECSPGGERRNSLFVGIWPQNANPICDRTTGNDPGAGSINSGGGGGGTGGLPQRGDCLAGYNEQFCEPNALGGQSWIHYCCIDGTSFGSSGCSTCPSDHHVCNVCDSSTCTIACISNSDPLYSDTCPSATSGGPSGGACNQGWDFCLIGGVESCCLSHAPDDTCAYYNGDSARASTDCGPVPPGGTTPPGTTALNDGPLPEYCPASPNFVYFTTDASPGVCDYSYAVKTLNPCSPPDGGDGEPDGPMLDVPGGAC